jgi:electron transfer flavoprotein alpha subunit
MTAVAAGPGAEELAGAAAELGAQSLVVAEHEVFHTHAPRALARALAEVAERVSAAAVVGPGTERGNEVLAHLAALLDLPLAANCIAAELRDPAAVTRVRWGGSLLEEARLHAPVKLLTVQPHAVAAEPAPSGEAAVERLAPALSAADLAVRAAERVSTATGGVTLAEAKVVVSGGRGVGSAEGFAVIEELAELLDAAVGCSRAVTMAGWRPHTDQVGQTGTKIAPEIYISCGVSGATQHMAGCKGAKAILAINSDREASIFGSADYGVVGDLHAIVPAIAAEVRKARGA